MRRRGGDVKTKPERNTSKVPEVTLLAWARLNGLTDGLGRAAHMGFTT